MFARKLTKLPAAARARRLHSKTLRPAPFLPPCLFTRSLLWRTDFFSPTSYPPPRLTGLYREGKIVDPLPALGPPAGWF